MRAEIEESVGAGPGDDSRRGGRSWDRTSACGTSRQLGSGQCRIPTDRAHRRHGEATGSPGRTGGIAATGGPPLSDKRQCLLARPIPPSAPPLPVVTRRLALTRVAVSIGAVPLGNGSLCGRGGGTVGSASLRRRMVQPRGQRRRRHPQWGSKHGPPHDSDGREGAAVGGDGDGDSGSDSPGPVQPRMASHSWDASVAACARRCIGDCPTRASAGQSPPLLPLLPSVLPRDAWSSSSLPLVPPSSLPLESLQWRHLSLLPPASPPP